MIILIFYILMFNNFMKKILDTFIIKYNDSTDVYQKLFYLNLIENLSILNNLDYNDFIKSQLESNIENKKNFRLRKNILLIIDSECIINSKPRSDRAYIKLWSYLRRFAHNGDFYKLKVNIFELNLIKKYFFDAILLIIDINNDINLDILETSYKLYKDNKLKKFSYYVEIANKL